MLRLAVSNSPASVAWAALDKAMIQLHEMQLQAARSGDTPEAKAERLARVWDALRLEKTFRDAFLAETDPDAAA